MVFFDFVVKFSSYRRENGDIKGDVMGEMNDTCNSRKTKTYVSQVEITNISANDCKLGFRTPRII